MKVKNLLKVLNINSEDDSIIIDIIFSPHTKDINKKVLLIVSLNQLNEYQSIKNKIKPLLIISAFKLDNVIYYKDLKKEINKIFIHFYKIDFNKIKLIAITGTEKKSSLAKLLFDTLKFANKKVKLISTQFKDNDIYNSELTTPQGNIILKYLKESIDNNYEYFIFEASSIAIKEYRLNYINPNFILLTNLKQDHLDYHKTKENYYNAKKEYILNANSIIISKLDSKKLKIINNLNHIRNYKIKNNKITYRNNNYIFNYLNEMHLSIIPYILEFLKLENIKVDILNLKYPEGRLEIISKKPLIMLDYAHSSSSFNNTCKYFNRICKGNKIIVFGSGGEREKQKRKKYGSSALKYFDIRIVTEDNSRNEKLDLIIKEIIGNNKDKFIIVKKRKNALKYAFSLIKSDDDGILFIGKGIENYISVRNRLIPYNEKEEIINHLKKIRK